MPKSNLPDPSNIPDMSLGERADKKAPQPIPSWEVPTSVQQPAPSKGGMPHGTPTSPEAREWKEGDRCLAPWEPVFLYPGTIQTIQVDEARGDRAVIDFDDGAQGEVYLFSICPLEVKAGLEVQVRRHGGALYVPGEVVEISEQDVRVRYPEGESEWTTFANLRIPCVANGPGATPYRYAPWQSQAAAATSGGGIPWGWVIGISVLICLVRGCMSLQN